MHGGSVSKQRRLPNSSLEIIRSTLPWKGEGTEVYIEEWKDMSREDHAGTWDILFYIGSLYVVSLNEPGMTLAVSC